MKTFFITFRSLTYAQRGEQTLRSGGIKSRMRRTPRWMEERGCGYGVEITTPVYRADFYGCFACPSIPRAHC